MVTSRGRLNCAFLAFLAGAIFDADPSLVAAPEADVLPMSVVDNRIFVEVKINGQGPYLFLVDTGSSVTTLSPDLAKRLRLSSAGEGSGSGAGEKQVTYSNVQIASATVGTTAIGPLTAPAIDLSQIAVVVGFRRCDGVLGAELFQRHVVTIDEDRGKFIIQDARDFKAPADAIGVPITIEDGGHPSDNSGMPTVNGVVNGIAGLFEIDTGDRSSLTLFGPFWLAHHLDHFIGPTVTSMTGYGIGGPIRSMVGRPQGFTMAGLELPPPVTRLSLQKAGSFTRSAYAGSIGMGILKRFVVSFDYPHRRMWLVKGRHFDAPDQYDRSGLWLGFSGEDGLRVVDVAVGSPAAEAGVIAGDEVDAINEIPAHRSTLFSLRSLLSNPGLHVATLRVHRNGGSEIFQIALRDQIAPARPS